MGKTLKNFDRQVPRTILKGGKKCYDDGNVISMIDLTPDHYVGLIKGDGANYRVNIKFEGNQIVENKCDCPYEWDDTCKHVVAALFDLKNSEIRPFIHAPISISSKTPSPNEVKELNNEELLLKFSRLSQTDQRLLKIAALFWEAIPSSKLMQLFNQCGFLHEHQLLYPQYLKPVLLQFVEEGIMTLTKDNTYRLLPKFSDAICEERYRTDDEFTSIVRHLKRESSNYYSSSFRKYPKLFRDFRFAYFDEDATEFKEVYTTLLDYANYNEEKLLSHWLPEPFSKEKLDKIPKDISVFLLQERLKINLFELEVPGDAFDYVKENLSTFSDKDQEEFGQLLSRFYIYQGEWDALNDLVKILPPYALKALAGIHFLTKGKTDLSLLSFEDALLGLRQKTGNIKSQFQAEEGIFQVLARYKTQDPAQEKIVDTHLRWLLKSPDEYTMVFECLKAVKIFLQNDRKNAQQVLRDSSVQPPLLSFFKHLAQFWVDRKELDTEGLILLHTNALSNGYKWLAMEIRSILEMMGKLTEVESQELADYLEETELTPLLQVLPKIEDWEIAIKALQTLGDNASPRGAAAENRLVWLVDFEGKVLQGRVQTLGKSGWSKGRAITYQRLKKGEITFTSSQDDRVIGSLSYGYGSELEVLEDLTWKYLVGHPYLFLLKSPEIAVQFMEEQPRLLAQHEGEGFRLSFSHDINEVGFQIIKETPTRYLLLNITEKVAQIASAFNGNSLSIPERGTHDLRQTISSLSNIIQVESVFKEDDLPTVDSDSRPCVHLLPTGDGFHLEVYVKPFKNRPPYVRIAKGEPTLITSVNGIRTATTRDIDQERKNLESLKNRVPLLEEIPAKSSIWNIQNAEQCLALLMQLGPLVDDNSIVLEWPKGERFRITHIANLDQLKIEINEKNNWFEVEGEIQIDENQVLTIQQLLSLNEKQGQFIELSQGKFLALTDEFRRRLEQISGLVNLTKDGIVQLHPLAAPAIQEFTDALKHVKTDDRFKQGLSRLENAFSKKFELSKSFNAVLRPYQMEGFQWLHRCADWGVGACLADDMGLGKTVQALALLTDRAKDGACLVVAPASVCRNWMAETKKFSEGLNPILFGEGDRHMMIEEAGEGDVLITTYDLMTREGEAFTAKKFATIILDEAQAIKNKATKRSEVAMGLEADFKIVMTGTPVENHLGELWNLFQFANPGLLGSLDDFTHRFAIPIEKNKDEGRREQLRKLLQPFILRRKKDEVLHDLPTKTEVTLTAVPSPAERAYYEALRRNALSNLEGDNTHGGQKHFRILAEIMKLRRAACHPKLADKTSTLEESAKLNLFGETLDDLLDNGHKALVFSQFVGHLKILEQHLISKNVSYQYLDGSTPLATRQKRIEAFQDGEGDVFLISLKAGGTGLNLTVADYVIHMDPWWNPAVEDQATDRAHRIGQQRPVTVYRLVVEGTIEEKILQLHEKKRDLADSLLKGTDVSAKLTSSDLIDLISGKL